MVIKFLKNISSKFSIKAVLKCPLNEAKYNNAHLNPIFLAYIYVYYVRKKSFDFLLQKYNIYEFHALRYKMASEMYEKN